MNIVRYLYRSLADAAGGRRLFSVFLPALLWGDIFDAQGAETRRVYTPTRAQQRLDEETRQRNARIQALRQTPTTAAPVRNATANPPPPTAAPKIEKLQPTPIRIRYIWLNSRRFILLQDAARYYAMRISYRKDGLTLSSARDSINFQYDRRMVTINRVNMYMTHAPVLRGALVYLDEKDFLLVIDPVIRNTPLWKHPLRTILVDAGHGGKDNGAPGTRGLLEKNLNLAIARKLAVRLQKLGYRVVMTRNSDTALTLQQRAELCERIKPNLFLSVHCNAAGKGIRGIETYAMTPNDTASTSEKKRGSSTGPGNSFDKNNYRLAYEIQKNTTFMTRAEDRGVKHARFFVLRNATCPAILVESGFITHPSEGALLAQGNYQDRIVSGIVAGITAYAKALNQARKN